MRTLSPHRTTKPALYGAAPLDLALCGLAEHPVGVGIHRGHGRPVMSDRPCWLALMLAWSQVESLAVFYLFLAGDRLFASDNVLCPPLAVVAKAFSGHKKWGVDTVGRLRQPSIHLSHSNSDDQMAWRDALVTLDLVI